tara:strand:- start:344 stop:727 length:384 start_codon:yes stop_codon:yes gene_type:complete
MSESLRATYIEAQMKKETERVTNIYSSGYDEIDDELQVHIDLELDIIRRNLDYRFDQVYSVLMESIESSSMKIEDFEEFTPHQQIMFMNLAEEVDKWANLATDWENWADGLSDSIQDALWYDMPSNY